MASEDVNRSESAMNKIVKFAEEAKLAREDIKPTSYAVLSVCKSLFAGGVAGGLSRTAVAPLERLKILLQVQNPHNIKYNGTVQGLKYIMRTEGFRGLFKGNGTNCARIVPNSAVKFFSYEQASKGILYMYRQQTGNEDAELTPLLRLGAGACAGIIAMSATYPMDMVRGRLTVQTDKSPYQYRGNFHALSTVFHQEGPRALYRGWLPSVIGVVPYVGLNFSVYESLKDWLVKSKSFGLAEDNELGVVTRLACGAAAGTVGQTVAYPLDVIRRRMQMVGWKDASSIVTGDGRGKVPLEYTRMIDAFRKTVRYARGPWTRTNQDELQIDRKVKDISKKLEGNMKQLGVIIAIHMLLSFHLKKIEPILLAIAVVAMVSAVGCIVVMGLFLRKDYFELKKKALILTSAYNTAIKELSSFLLLVKKADIGAEEIKDVVNKKAIPYIYAKDISTVEYGGAGKLKGKFVKSYLKGISALIYVVVPVLGLGQIVDYYHKN